MSKKERLAVIAGTFGFLSNVLTATLLLTTAMLNPAEPAPTGEQNSIGAGSRGETAQLGCFLDSIQVERRPNGDRMIKASGTLRGPLPLGATAFLRASFDDDNTTLSSPRIAADVSGHWVTRWMVKNHADQDPAITAYVAIESTVASLYAADASPVRWTQPTTRMKSSQDSRHLVVNTQTTYDYWALCQLAATARVPGGSSAVTIRFL